jgi:hypothetical protein
MSEVKGPVMDRLKNTHFLKVLTGKVFLTQFAAVSTLREEIAREASCTYDISGGPCFCSPTPPADKES